MSKEYAQEVYDGPDPDVDPGPTETDEDIAEAERLLAEYRNMAQSGNALVATSADWDLRDEDLR
jgi:hypothetical protein